MRGATARIFKTVKQAPARRAPRRGPRRRRGRDRRDRDRRAGPASTTRRAGCRSPTRDRGATAGTLLPAARLLHLQAALPRRSTRSTTSSARLRGAATTPRATPAPTSPAGARCSPAAARRSACTSRCGCCATARTPRSRRASRATRCAASPRCPTAPTGCTGCGSSASTCATRPRWSRWPTRSPSAGPLDILINNAAQTVRRSPGAYAPLVDAEAAPLPRRRRCRRWSRSATPATPHPAGARRARAASHWTPTAAGAHRARADRRLGRRPSAIAAGTAIDAGGLVPDLHHVNSWTQRVDEVDPLELLEVQLCNMTAPFILVSRLRAGAGGVAGAAHLRRQRLGDGGPVQPRLQGPRPPAHQHGQGRAEHADPHQRRGDARPTAS